MGKPPHKLSESEILDWIEEQNTNYSVNSMYAELARRRAARVNRLSLVTAIAAAAAAIASAIAAYLSN
ncbi:MAG: hypothetical protein OYK82_06255 [Gammaproteobacteria bacterium]|nr:hypothetical protein [Gammaproteobacteria bacterium]